MSLTPIPIWGALCTMFSVLVLLLGCAGDVASTAGAPALFPDTDHYLLGIHNAGRLDIAVFRVRIFAFLFRYCSRFA